jgi:hypothetical protein
MNREVSVFGILDEPLVGKAVSAEDELVAVPLQRITYRAVPRVNSRPRANDDAFFLVDDLILSLVIELGDLDLSRFIRECMSS